MYFCDISLWVSCMLYFKLQNYTSLLFLSIFFFFFFSEEDDEEEEEDEEVQINYR